MASRAAVLFVWADSSSTGIHATELSYLLLNEGRVLIFPGTPHLATQWREYVRITMLEPIETLKESRGAHVARA